MSSARFEPDAPLTPASLIGPWMIVMREGVLFRHQFPDLNQGRQALHELNAGTPPAAVCGRSVEKLPVANIRSVQWIPATRTVLIRGHWWRDPWWFTFEEEASAEALFQSVLGSFPDAGEMREERVGPQDVAVDPRILVGVILVVAGLIALIGGALEGLGQVPVTAFEWLFLLLGKQMGIAAVCATGLIAAAAGIYGLYSWFRNRPQKFVVTL